MKFSGQVIESGRLPPMEIMAKDAWLLETLNSTHSPFLHLYEWETSCLTYGYFTRPADYLHLEALERWGIQKARRPTGGGIIFHLTDLAFSILLPSSHPCFSSNTLENYAFINQKVAEVIVHFTAQQAYPSLLAKEISSINSECQGFCMAKPTPYDLMIENKKVGGAAQRRTRQGLLHQASLSLTFPPQTILSTVLKQEVNVLQAMQKHSYCLLPFSATQQDLEEARHRLKELLVRLIGTL